MWFVYNFLGIFGRKRPKCPYNCKYFPPKAKFPGNEMTTFNMFSMHVWLDNARISFPGNCAFGGKSLQFWGERYHSDDGYFCLFLTKKILKFRGKKITFLTPFFYHIPGKCCLFCPALDMKISCNDQDQGTQKFSLKSQSHALWHFALFYQLRKILLETNFSSNFNEKIYVCWSW